MERPCPQNAHLSDLTGHRTANSRSPIHQTSHPLGLRRNRSSAEGPAKQTHLRGNIKIPFTWLIAWLPKQLLLSDQWPWQRYRKQAQHETAKGID